MTVVEALVLASVLGLAAVLRLPAAAAQALTVTDILDREVGPDAAIFGIEGLGPGARAGHVIERLAAAGIPNVFVDFLVPGRRKPCSYHRSFRRPTA